MTGTTHPDDAARAANLLIAQDKALALFGMIGRELIRPGMRIR